MKKGNILILGALGQIGTELTVALRNRYSTHAVIASDIYMPKNNIIDSGPFELVDATDYDQLLRVVSSHQIDTIYLLAAMLSVRAESNPEKAWDLNMKSLMNVLNLAKNKHIKYLFWPSSIAVFGPKSPQQNTPQHTIMDPITVYGISKLAGERWCKYYHTNYGVDVRSLRYPGIISWQTQPGGGTTDYAVDIFHKALTEASFCCYLNFNTALPMMYIDDAIDATLQLMAAPTHKISVRTSYNISAMSFTPNELAQSIQNHKPNFEITYAVDSRQNIADSWPDSINDQLARQDWNWQPKHDLSSTTKLMLEQLSKTHNML